MSIQQTLLVYCHLHNGIAAADKIHKYIKVRYLWTYQLLWVTTDEQSPRLNGWCTDKHNRNILRDLQYLLCAYNIFFQRQT